MSYHNDPLNATDTKNINVYNHRRIGKIFGKLRFSLLLMSEGQISLNSFGTPTQNICSFSRFGARMKSQ